ncbi:hypothetical protein AVEN_234430-1 [Araneus ventricosus]|uniref:Uncharacterized protein n=1 Tax=Araneus ventricosus TaxID=182803 RepID=A0A4Y2AB26_ARAVE|nr:hypothetical protein AVEN_234430-1 [Araneus ventricosus]
MTRITRRGEVPDFAPATVISTELLFCFNSHQTWCLVMGSCHAHCLRTSLTLQRILKISLPHRFLPLMIENAWEGKQKNPQFCLEERSFGRRVSSNETLKSLSSTAEPVVNEIVSLAKIRGLEVDIDEIAEEHNKELTTEELMELHCVQQQEVMEEITAKQQ